MQKEKLLALVNIIALSATITANGMAMLIPINGLNTGEVSDLYPSLFTPAGVTFSIWSVIYFLLIGFVMIQWKVIRQDYFTRLSYLFIISCLLNASWILAWHYLFVGLSILIMVGLLIALIKIFLVLEGQPMSNVWQWLFMKTSFTIYLAWICVATIANAAAFLISNDWYGGVLTQTQWTLIMMGVATLLAIIFLIKYQAYPFAAVVMWALAGISLNQLAIITPAAMVLIVVILIACVVTFLQVRQKGIN